MKKLLILLCFLGSLPSFSQDMMGRTRDPLLAAALFDTGGRQFVTDKYGPRANPMGGGQPGSFHNGDDLATKSGTKVLAIADGTVILCGFGDKIYGKYMVIRTAEGLDFKYAHMSETWYGRGSAIKEGQVIGLSGNTGTSTGPHLHVEITMDLSRYLENRVMRSRAAIMDASMAEYLRYRSLKE
jgi:murein DD-endopeptidase MepM/ murein hydrolase activator NlpD